MAAKEATFIFDGACGICRTWVDYWRALTGDRVAYRPYQEAAAEFPAVAPEEFKRASQLIAADGSVLSGAAATFKLLSYGDGAGRSAWWWLYRHVPGFAWLSEAAYGFLSTHRAVLAGLTQTLWGRKLEPARYALVSWLFLRGLGLVYLAAFLSLVPQILGLVGKSGILPLGEYLEAARAEWGTSAYWQLPTIFWLNASDAALLAGAWIGVVLAALLTLGIPYPSIVRSTATPPSPLIMAEPCFAWTAEGRGGGGASLRRPVDTPLPDPPPQGGREIGIAPARLRFSFFLARSAQVQRLALVVLFALYLSFVYAGQIFMSYQWDMLLVEVGFLAIFLTGGSVIIVWLYRLLLFRFLFLAGVAKIVSGDATWRQLTALDYHFFTQPLPSPLAYYASQLPHWMLEAATALTLIIELVAVALIFMPRRPRMVAAVLVVAFQIGIMLTGNYNWFNILTVLLCLFLLDDQAVRWLLGALGRPLFPSPLAGEGQGGGCPPRPRWCTTPSPTLPHQGGGRSGSASSAFLERIDARAPRAGRIATVISAVVAMVVVPVGLNTIYAPLAEHNLPLAGEMGEAIAPLLIVNPYGLFATVTTTRPVIVFEGSDTGQSWKAYSLPFLPGPVDRAPTWNIPYQPRLDWQLWLAAYGSIGEHRFIERVMQRLLEGSAPVTALFAGNPFPDSPPRHVRALLYDYRFTDNGPRDGNAWWSRRQDGVFYPSVTLDNFRSR